jgi:hypothetical protein
MHIQLTHEQAPTVERASDVELMTQLLSISADVPVMAAQTAPTSMSDVSVAITTLAPSLRADRGYLLSTVMLRL